MNANILRESVDRVGALYQQVRHPEELFDRNIKFTNWKRTPISWKGYAMGQATIVTEAKVRKDL